MKTFDLAIIGGGMVGLALAASLEKQPLRIALIEAFPSKVSIATVTNRVSALNLASQKLLTELNVWQQLIHLRATEYNSMYVWEKDSFANIQFNTQGLGISHLGHIVENHLIQHCLWEKVKQQKNVEIITALPQKLGITESNAILTLNNDQILSAKLIIGADGANSWLRKQANIPLIFRDYGHHALVCNVETTEPHQHCARQVFAKDSILAFLPLHQDNWSSIVWSLPAEQAKQLATCDEQEFNHTLSTAFDMHLGLCKLQSDRKTVQLTARYARDFAVNRIVLLGDAAHTIHPLAGLGVNLGFQDVVTLSNILQENLNLGVDIGKYRHLRSYERQRKKEAIKMLIAMQGLKDLFTGENPIKKLVRGIGLSATDKLDFVKTELMKQALGL
ncbi:FAD-dependent monooxygenase [Pasteurella oralis]|uniref:FAD-dependent monooxygenase n=1 Tax=Pasteurella oralis TaxID=1071947 RepID=A0ABW4NR56_9PAST|nr:FAD-dependent monooxygenase [Pasteurella oralis]